MKRKQVPGQKNGFEHRHESASNWRIVNFMEEQFIRSATFFEKLRMLFFDPVSRGVQHRDTNQLVSKQGTATPTDQQSAFSFLSFFAQSEPVAEKNKPVVAAILNESSERALQYELTLMTIRPNNFQEMVGAKRPDLLIVEIPQRGQKGSWDNHETKTTGVTESAFAELLQWTRANGIPSIFWFSDNSVDNGQYFETARMFDFILVSNIHQIQNYKSFFGNDKVLPFPNAIQPRIQNPVSERKEGLLACLTDDSQSVKACYGYDGSINIGLDDKPGFPVPRNVVSSLAFGIPVISTNTKLKQSAFKDVLLFSEKESDTQAFLQLLKNDPLARMKISVRGIRFVMEAHRFDLRLSEIFAAAGLGFEMISLPDICLLLDVTNSRNPDIIAKAISKQTYQPKEIILLSENEPDRNFAERFASLVGAVRIHQLSYYQNRLSNLILTMSPCHYFAMWNNVDVYGPEYLRDYALATVYAESPAYGKSCFYAWDNGQLNEINRGGPYQFTSGVPVGTLMLRRDHLATFNFLSLLNPDGFYDAFIPEILALDSLNFIRNTSLTEIAENISAALWL